MDVLVDGGLPYHCDTLKWIVANEGQTAYPEVFTSCHAQGLCRVILSSVASFGLTTLVAGSRELNIMNFHVGKLLQQGHHPGHMLLFAWPPWSLVRGWAYLLIIIGTAPLFLSIVRRVRPDWRSLCPYLAAGCALAIVDLGLKIAFAPSWRQILLAAYL